MGEFYHKVELMNFMKNILTVGSTSILMFILVLVLELNLLYFLFLPTSQLMPLLLQSKVNLTKEIFNRTELFFINLFSPTSLQHLLDSLNWRQMVIDGLLIKLLIYTLIENSAKLSCGM